MKCYAMKVGEVTSFDYQRYIVREYIGKYPCRECELPLELCKGPMGQTHFCHPEQREDKKQIIFKKQCKLKKRKR